MSKFISSVKQLDFGVASDSPSPRSPPFCHSAVMTHSSTVSTSSRSPPFSRGQSPGDLSPSCSPSPQGHTNSTGNSSSRPAARNIDVCEAAMEIVGLLEPEKLSQLEQFFATTSNGSLSRTEFAVLLGELVAQCPASRSMEHRCEDLRKSEQDFQRLLHETANLLDREVLDYVAQSVDKYNTNRITFSAFMDFLINSGRTVTGDLSTSNEDGNATKAQPSSTRNGLPTAKKEGSGEPMAPVLFPVAQPEKTPYCFVTTLASEQKPFAAATARHIDIVGLDGQAVPSSKRMVCPIDPSHVITCLHYAQSLQEIIVGVSNCKVFAFNANNGRLVRECKATGQPTCVSWMSPANNQGHHSVHDIGVVHCGQLDGVLAGMVTPLPGVLRVSFTVRLGQFAIKNLVALPSVNLVCASSGSSIFLACARTGALKQRPYHAGSIVSSLAYSPLNGGAVYTTVDSPNSLYFFSKRTLSSTVGNGPAEICRDRSIVGEPTQAIMIDPMNKSRLVTVDVSGYLRHWDVSTLTPIYEDGEESGSDSLRVPNSALSVASYPAERMALLIGKSGFHRLMEVPKAEITAAQESIAGGAQGGSNRNLSDGLVDVLPCNSAHVVLSKGTHPLACGLAVYKNEIKLRQFQPYGRTIWSVPLTTKLREKKMKRLAKQQPSAVCYLPGHMSLLLGMASGALISLSIEPSSLGECRVLSTSFASVEIASIAVAEKSHTVIARLFDGTLLTGQLDLAANTVGPSSLVTAAGDAKAVEVDNVHDLCYIYDSHDQKVKVFDFAPAEDGMRWRSSTAPLDLPDTRLSQSPHRGSSLGSNDTPSKFFVTGTDNEEPTGTSTSTKNEKPVDEVIPVDDNIRVYMQLCPPSARVGQLAVLISCKKGAVVKLFSLVNGKLVPGELYPCSFGGPVSSMAVSEFGECFVAHSHGDVSFFPLRPISASGSSSLCSSIRTLPNRRLAPLKGAPVNIPRTDPKSPLLTTPRKSCTGGKPQLIASLADTIVACRVMGTELERGVVVASDSEAQYIQSSSSSTEPPTPTPMKPFPSAGEEERNTGTSLMEKSLSSLSSALLLARRHTHSAGLRVAPNRTTHGNNWHMMPKRVHSASQRGAPRLPTLPQAALRNVNHKYSF